MSGKTASDYSRDYTRPHLRERLKESFKKQGKGGRPGQWSARKSQLLAQAYEAEGGGYTVAKRGPQRSLEEWTGQAWQTAKASGRARDQGRMHRYLPAKVWRMLSSSERKQAERTKLQADSGGKQVAQWPKSVERAMTAAGHTGKAASSVSRKALRAYARRLGVEVSAGASSSALAKAIQQAPARGKDARSSSGATKQSLYERARRLDIPGRSRMSKAELQQEIERRTH